MLSYRNLIEPLRRRPALIGLASAFYSLFMLIGIMFWLSEVLEQRVSGGQILKGLIISLPVLTFLLTTLLSEHLYRWLKIRLSIFSGLVITVVAIILIPPCRNIFMIWPVIALMGIGLGIVTPAVDTLSTNLTSAELRGTITTFFGGVRCAGAAAGPLTLALLMKRVRCSPSCPGDSRRGRRPFGAFLLREEEIPGDLK